MIFSIKKNNKGFVLVETIVAVGLFATVMTIGIGSLLSIIDANRRAQAYKVVVNNVNLAMESVSKDIRVGSDYNCGSLSGGNCPNGDNSIYFVSGYTDEIVAYRLSDNKIQRSRGGSTFTNITAPDITISDLKFYVSGVGSDGLQPMVFMIIRGYTGESGASRMDFDLQSAVSQRTLRD